MENNLLCLGLEGTAHTFGASVVNDKGKILSDVRDMYTTRKGGIIPNEAAEHHKEVKDKIIAQALKEANVKIEYINLISFSNSPGLPPCLVVVKDEAVRLAKKYKKDLIGVNHCIAHFEIGRLLTKVKDPIFIFVSGANTQILSLENKKFRILGETLDIGLGNALDKFGRGINLGFPSGPEIEKLAKNGEYIELPYTVKGMDLAFSGIVTEAINRYKKGYKREDLCYSTQETLFSMLTEVVERALAFTDKKEALLIGGVAANKRLIEMLTKMCKDRKSKLFAVPLKYSGDQAVMIAWQGILEYKAGRKDNLNIDINPNQRTDEINVKW